MPRIGVIGTLVWDVIHGRDPAAPPTEEWGGVAYALAGLDASLPPEWELVPLIKVGRDLSAEAHRLVGGLDRVPPGRRCMEVPTPNNRVVLRYQSIERRCERMAGGVPGWTWGELGPLVHDLDALYLNFISGYEMGLATAQALRQGFAGPIYADLHSLLLGLQHDGMRVLRSLPDLAEWLACFDVVQVNEEEMQQLSSDPLSLSADALAAGVSLLVVTIGARGAIYVAAPGFERLAQDAAGRPRRPVARPLAGAGGAAVRSERVPTPSVEVLDPTGCGDVLGSGLWAGLLAGTPVPVALAEANRLAARNAGFRGASGLSRHLRGEWVTP